MKRSQQVWYWVITAVFTAVLANFCIYLFQYERLGQNFGSSPNVLDLSMFALLCVPLFYLVVMFALSWTMTGLLQRKQHHSVYPDGLPDPNKTKVAFITTFVPGSEPLSMLAQTLKAMRMADYPHDTWVLDEGDDRMVKVLCRVLGVKHFSRHGVENYNTIGGKFSAKTKGGNHNAWYDAHGMQYDFVAQIDTDFFPRKDFLTATLVKFADPDVGWVGTPQVYKNTESFLARGAAEQTYGFYGPIMKGLSNVESTMLIGANHIIRVEALRRADLYYAHLTEDLATGMTLHSQGWKSVYVAEPLAEGEGPTSWSAYFKQQFRWAKGSIDLQFTQLPKLMKSMPLFQRLLYGWMLLFYWNGAAYGAGILLLLLYFGFGWEAANVEALPFFSLYLPVLLVMEVAMLWTQQFNVRPKIERGLYLRARLLLIACMPVYLAAFIAALKDLGKHTEFEVTQKGTGSPVPVRKKKGSKNPFRPHFAVATLMVIGLAVGIILRNVNAIYIGWAVLTLAPLFILLFRPKWEIIKFEAVKVSRKNRQLTRALHEALDKHLIEPLVPQMAAVTSALALEELKAHLDSEVLLRTGPVPLPSDINK